MVKIKMAREDNWGNALDRMEEKLENFNPTDTVQKIGENLAKGTVRAGFSIAGGIFGLSYERTSDMIQRCLTILGINKDGRKLLNEVDNEINGDRVKEYDFKDEQVPSPDDDFDEI